MNEDPFPNIPPEHLDELRQMAEAGEIPKRKLAEDPSPTVNQLREEAGLAPLTPEQEAATQDIVDLTQELGLYDGESLDAYAVKYANAVAELQGACPFCGAEQPCPSHRAGG